MLFMLYIAEIARGLCYSEYYISKSKWAKNSVEIIFTQKMLVNLWGVSTKVALV